MSTMAHVHRLLRDTTETELSKLTDDTFPNQVRLPDPEICRTRYLGKSLDLWRCTVENSQVCEYAFQFDNGIICHHPDRRSFEKTVRL